MPPNSAGRLAHPASGREASSAAVRQAFQRTTRPKVPPKREELSHQGTSREKSGRPAARFGHEPWQAHARSPNRTGNSGTCSASAPARQTMTWCPRIRKRGVTLVAYGSEITTGNHARLTARRRCACDACSRGSRSPFDSCGPNGWPARCGARTSHSQIMVGARLKKGVSVARNCKCAAAVRASVSKFDRQGNYECAAQFYCGKGIAAFPPKRRGAEPRGGMAGPERLYAVPSMNGP